MTLSLKYRLLCGSVVLSSPLLFREWYSRYFLSELQKFIFTAVAPFPRPPQASSLHVYWSCMENPMSIMEVGGRLFRGELLVLRWRTVVSSPEAPQKQKMRIVVVSKNCLGITTSSSMGATLSSLHPGGMIYGIPLSSSRRRLQMPQQSLHRRFREQLSSSVNMQWTAIGGTFSI